MSQPYYYTVYGEQDVRRTGARHASISPYGPSLGGQVFLGLQNDREWAVLCERVLGRPDLITDERFATNRQRVSGYEALRPWVADRLCEQPRQHWIEALTSARHTGAGGSSSAWRASWSYASWSFASQP